MSTLPTTNEKVPIERVGTRCEARLTLVYVSGKSNSFCRKYASHLVVRHKRPGDLATLGKKVTISVGGVMKLRRLSTVGYHGYS